MRKILFGVFGCLVAVCAHAAQVANLDYVHKLIQQKWDISIPIKADNPMLATNMKYLLTAVDVANEILNGEKTTDYGNGEFATLHAADTVATNQAVETLVKQNKIEYKFFMDIDLSQYDDNGNFWGTTTITEFSFDISAAGTFYIDWGDGTTETIKKADTNPVTYSHDYGTATGVFRVSIGGRATDYSDDTYTSVLDFSERPGPISIFSQAITNIDGSLGAIFGTLADGTQPRFYETFYGASNMKGSIPANLFAGISGAPASYMFAFTFHVCSGLTSIPDGLFAGISGAPASHMFDSTFSGCSGLTSIPENLFTGISGAPAQSMFSSTFSGCSGLTSIPDGLFAGISGAPARYMFDRTFDGCSGLTSIPENLFGNISGTAQSSMFYSTFYNCTSLTGPSARINGQYLYEIWPDATSDQVGDMYYNATKLDDYSSIPDVWK